jgi:hypothetical protein
MYYNKYVCDRFRTYFLCRYDKNPYFCTTADEGA